MTRHFGRAANFCRGVAGHNFVLVLLIMLAGPGASAVGTGFTCSENDHSIQIANANYVIQIEKKGFRYGFNKPSGEVIVPSHMISGLEFGGHEAAATRLNGADENQVRLEVVNAAGESADVTIRPFPHYVKFLIEPRLELATRIVARTGGTGPTFGLGDNAARQRDRTELTGYTNENLFADGLPCGRLISNFAISPGRGFAAVNIDPNPKIVRIAAGENAQGSVRAKSLPALYYFLGEPPQIYSDFLAVRDHEGYPVFKPKYEWFGVGWEAFGALAWDTSQKTATENVNHYLDLGYPLSWMVIGSGFWPRQNPRFYATTSFGKWDTNLYPDPRGLIETFHRRGLKFILGLRIAFITNGLFTADGVKKGCFLMENGAPKVFKISFPTSPCYLLDATKPAAVDWYVGLCQKWLSCGVDGFKEDLFGYPNYVLRDDKINPVNAALMSRGVYVMGRNGYLGSAMDLHRFEDFNQNQFQDRGPLNGLAFAYSGFPYVYPDIVGGTFGEGRKVPDILHDGLDKSRAIPGLADAKMRLYIMRNAQYASVNPAMSMGVGPWLFGSEQVSAVMLKAAQLHGRLQPYIYSAAVDAFETGFPWTLAPLPLLWPADPEVYRLENSSRRGYQWMLGPSLMATPLYGDDYATALTRDVYLPGGKWMDYDTGEIFDGQRVLKGFALPPGKTPLFIGGKGVVVERTLDTKILQAIVYPVAPNGSVYRFVYPDGVRRSLIANEAANWRLDELEVLDDISNAPVSVMRDAKMRSVRFSIEPGHNYRVINGILPAGR